MASDQVPTAAENDAVIAVEGLVKHYGSVHAVNDVSFTVHQGEIFGFLGPNGAGKTTTISILCTLLKPTAGRVRVGGYDVIRQRNGVRHSIGLVFQEPALDLKLTAEENLYLHARLYGVPAREYRERLHEVLALVELWERRKDRVETYSGGMKRRLEIARGLIHYPKVLFLDEPTLGLDPQTRNHLLTYILRLKREKGMTIFLTTHYMNEAEHCDRIGIIDHGRLVTLDTPARLKQGVGGDVISLRSSAPAAALIEELQRKLGLAAVTDGDCVRFETRDADRHVPEIIRSLTVPIESIEIHKPTLDDVFLKLTGRALRDVQDSAERVRQSFRGMRRRG
jgi:ABC-2 type transport system ATP-binding protein